MTYLWPKGEAITVKSDELATPVVFIWQGRAHQVQQIAKRWRVNQGWRRKRVWREYFKLITQTGLLVVIFLEQCLKVARDLAGFTPGQGEQLRRALGSKRGAAEVERFHHEFITGARARGVSADVAEMVFDQLRAFGSYSFAKSHAASFAMLVYQSAWLKHYFPIQFTCALLRNQPMGFRNPAILLGDARRHGLTVLSVDLNHSYERCTVEAGSLRLGLNYIAGLGEASIARLVEARKVGAFAGLADFCRRTRLPRRLVENLILAGAMDGWGRPCRRLLWELGQLHYVEEELDLVFPDEDVSLPPLSPAEATELEQAIMGLSTGEHVMAHYRDWLSRRGVLGSQELAQCPAGRCIRIAGLLVVHQSPPTAKGFHFLTLEDNEGLVDITIRPQIYARYRRLLHTSHLLIIEGMVQRESGVVNRVGVAAGNLLTPAEEYERKITRIAIGAAYFKIIGR